MEEKLTFTALCAIRFSRTTPKKEYFNYPYRQPRVLVLRF